MVSQAGVWMVEMLDLFIAEPDLMIIASKINQATIYLIDDLQPFSGKKLYFTREKKNREIKRKKKE